MGKYVLDIETTGLDRKVDNINFVGIYSLDTYEIYQTFNKKDFLKLYDELNLDCQLVICHNATFDINFLKYKYGCKFNKVIDTQILYYLYNPYLKKYGLKDLVKLLYKKEYDIDKDLKKQTTGETIEYNKLDLQYTGLIYSFVTNRLTDKEIKLAEYLTKISFIYDKATEQGIKTDKKLCKKVLKEYTKKLDVLEQDLINELGNINLNSPSQLSKALIQKGYNITTKTKKGSISTSISVLKELNTTLTNKILEYKKMSKLIYAFLQPYSLLDKIHPRFHLTRTTSGRTSSSEPNFQQLPRGNTIRNLITVPDDYYLVELDYSQMELRAAAHIAYIPNMLQAYNNNMDLHTETARAISGKDNISEQERYQAKAVNFGFLYGMTAKSFVDYAKQSYDVVISYEQAEQFRDSYFKNYPELKDYYVKIQQDMNKKGYIENPVGRRKRYPKDFKDNNLLSHINAPIQGFGSDVLVLSLLEISELPECDFYFKILGTVHDSILLAIKKKYLNTLDKIVHIMENPKYVKELMDEPLLVPLKADYNVFEHCWYGKKINYKITIDK